MNDVTDRYNLCAMWPTLPVHQAPVLAAERAHVWRIDLDVDADVRRRLAAHLSPDELARATRFRTEILMRRHQAAHGALRAILAGYLGIAPGALAIASDAQGKPYLADEPALAFNLSHSGPLALLAVARARPIGVDVEQVRALPDAGLVAGRFFAPAEVQAWSRFSGAAQTRAFYACWTRKEAYLKALGSGLARPLDSFVVSVDPDAPARLLSDAQDAQAAERWCLAALDPGPDAIGAVVVAAPLGEIVTLTFALE